ncbi:hypothetical protein IB286_06815 [Spongiibacter sp. KMU-158]|uniref:Type IV pilus assembly protein PilX n=1 Tax=Spongiibacter pelagi TaxID=2760804 RepID=A0A927BZZ8_9GAMM|nr:PilX N-terminal domain-containing pilus assembly protein [Spongiibacter pelagi]MBD2858720.1 hypothetical protein [Spongiibacter pelagi]
MIVERPSQLQNGMALLVCLVLMLIITIIASEAMQSATLQERMAGNAKETNLAFQAAEAALRDAELVLDGNTVGPFDGSNGMYESCAGGSQSRSGCSSPDWKDYHSEGWQAMNNFNENAAKQPEFIIQRMAADQVHNEVLDADMAIPGVGYYRIIARGFGASDRSMVVLSTTYRREE